MTRSFAAMLLAVAFAAIAAGQTTPPDTSRGDRMMAAYFEAETARIRDACLAGVTSRADWEARRPALLAQLREMLGLEPLPEKTELHPVITGQVEREGIVVEKLHFQSRPGLYVTGNLYRPATVERPLPAVVYVCGHAGVKKGDVSFGNKVAYQHHGIWFARHGYVCLTIDSLQLGEIEGIHHGTYRYGMWWWLNRGYTPAGVEAWNCIRALDYLQTRSEVDPARLGVTGRSGGGAYSWWLAALDDRTRAAVPVAGITDLENHVVDGTVEGHCDCMFFVNTYEWDYPQLAALVAPRALMITNTDSDSIFPVDGVWRTYEKTRRIYELLGAVDRLGLTITPGPHKDTPELRQPAFRWLNRWLRDEDPDVHDYSEKPFPPEELRVFAELPADQINTEIQEVFVPAAPAPAVPESREAWTALGDGWLAALQEKTFRGWPDAAEALALEPAMAAERQGLRLRAIDFTSQGAVRLRLFRVDAAGGGAPDEVRLIALDDAGWQEFLAWLWPVFAAELREETAPAADAPAGNWKELLASGKAAMVFVAPRGVGPTAWNPAEKKQIQVRRRFMLLGQTLEGQQVWDVRRAVQAVRAMDELRGARLTLQARGPMAGVAVYASLFEPNVAGLDLTDLPASHRAGPYLLNVNRILDIPAALALAAERCEVRLHRCPAETARFAEEVSHVCGWGEGRVGTE